MIPCIPEHIGEARCPECGENHKEYGALPNRALSPIDLDDILGIDSVDSLMPIFKVQGKDEEGYYMQVVPALVIVSGDTVRIVWFNPNTDNGWINVRTETDVEKPELLAEELGLTLRESAMQEAEIEGMKVIKDRSAA
ncbi:hypothetical protein [Haloarcula sp. K1]|uniref:hypothetical protein n=1 Tax=Haloarcula sp. K1 TaxID=1622207 RepID=UPI0007BB68A4|nr:hypothetical protein [Haloarcula sp. K1]KZX46319.1 hypothetical protein AV929_16240 [Haloarcula sp. K1]